MKKTIFYFLIPFVLLGIGFASFSAFLSEKTPPSVQNDFSQKVNLALRQTAHRLLKQAGDSTSRIAPIKQTDDNTYLAELEQGFNYDSLPVFLQKSFLVYDIKEKYIVSVWDCSLKQLLLGYTSLDLAHQQGGVPCSGRGQAGGCLNFTVTFTDSTPFLGKNGSILFVLGLLSALTLVGAVFLRFSYLKKKQIIAPLSHVEVEQAPQTIQLEAKHVISVGKSIFDTHNQTFTTNDSVQKLTSRESKLLEMFCEYPNELLDRDFILKTVWEDDGVLVTRTVDVFISRLRKILNEDTSLKIVNVHSRGYRFETPPSV